MYLFHGLRRRGFGSVWQEKVVSPTADLQLKAGVDRSLAGLQCHALGVVGDPSVVACTVWTHATAGCLVLFLIGRFMKALKRVPRQTTEEFAISAYEDR